MRRPTEDRMRRPVEDRAVSTEAAQIIVDRVRPGDDDATLEAIVAEITEIDGAGDE